MEKTTKWIVGGAAVISGLVALNLSRLSQFSKNFILTASARPYNLAWDHLVIAIDVTFKNPTDATLTLKHPTVLIYDSKATRDANQPVLSSTVSAKTYTISPNSQLTLQPILLTISLIDFSLGFALLNLVRQYIAYQPITIYVKALSQVNGTIPVTSESQNTFQRGKSPVSTPTPQPSTK